MEKKSNSFITISYPIVLPLQDIQKMSFIFPCHI